MNQPHLLSYQSAGLQSRENRQLRWLAGMHYIAGVLVAAQFPVIAVTAFTFAVSPQDRSLDNFVKLFAKVGMGSTCAWWLAFGILAAVSGFLISVRKLRLLSMLIAAFICFLFPFGTMAGIPALILLKRPAAKSLYRRNLKYHDGRLP